MSWRSLPRYHDGRKLRTTTRGIVERQHGADTGTTTSTQLSSASPAGLVLLAIVPHPDDEAYSMGGTLALAARQGAAVYVLCATRGEGGQTSDPALTTSEQVAGVRVEEMAASCRVLGVRPPLFLDYRDGELAGVNMTEAVGEIVQAIRAVRPHVVITLGEDGVYGHPDHIALHKLVMPAYRSAGGGSRFPEDRFGSPWAPERLLWTAYPRGLFRPQWEHMLQSEHAEAMRLINPDRLGVDPAEFAVAVDISGVAQTKLEAIRRHRTQLSDGDPIGLFPAGIVRMLLGIEYFQFGGGLPPPPGATDPFAGL
jgi:N-acetyl-1-D-myo-inositol-2-amino-2-deoxy-alpha-D-glucopyranoside deacetylase